MRWQKPSLLIATTILLTGTLIALLAQPAQASVELQTQEGDAVWFTRECATETPLAVWSVEPDPDEPEGKSLVFKIENAYPGYHLACDLFFANRGQSPFRVREISITNPNPDHLMLTAVEGPVAGKNLVHCPNSADLSWGADPAALPENCWSTIHLSLTIGPEAQQKTQYPFTVEVKLDK